MKKGQYSIETIFVIGISTLLLLPATIMFYDFLLSSSSEIIQNHVDQIGNSFVENTRLMYNYGNNAKIIVEYKFPDFIQNISIENDNTLIISYNSRGETAERVYFFGPDINVTMLLSESDITIGLKKIEFKSIDGGDRISIKRT